MDETVTPYYVRFKVKDRMGVIATIATMFAKYDVGIAATNSTYDTIDTEGEQWINLIFMVHACKWVRLKYVLRELASNDSIDRHPVVFRIETFNDK